MVWTKNVSRETASEYRDSLTESLVGQYSDYSEQYPVVNSIALNRSSFFLDAGCGTGRFLAHTVPGQRFVGVDLSLEMLKAAKRDVGRGYFVVGELEHLPFEDQKFDQIISVRVLQHVANQAEALNELSRVCQLGGGVVVLCLNSWTLHCVYKNIRMSRLGKVIDLPFQLLLGNRSMFSKWPYPYDSYCSMPELCHLFEQAGLMVEERKGGTLGAPWFFSYFYVGRIMERIAPILLRVFFRICFFVEKRLASVFPFKYLMDKIIVRGTRQQ